MGVVNLPSGRPTMKLTGGALRRLQAITPAGYEAQIDLTITDEGPMAQAFVIISAVSEAAEPARARKALLGLRRSGSWKASRRLVRWRNASGYAVIMRLEPHYQRSRVTHRSKSGV